MTVFPQPSPAPPAPSTSDQRRPRPGREPAPAGSPGPHRPLPLLELPIWGPRRGPRSRRSPEDAQVGPCGHRQNVGETRVEGSLACDASYRATLPPLGAFLECGPARRVGRVVECTGFENRRPRGPGVRIPHPPSGDEHCENNRRDGGVDERAGLLIRCTRLRVPRVRIPLSPWSETGVLAWPGRPCSLSP